MGTALPHRFLSQVSQRFLRRLRPSKILPKDLLTSWWKEEMDPRVVALTRIDEVADGVVLVLVANSALLQQLFPRRKEFASAIRQRFPKLGIRRVYFRVG